MAAVFPELSTSRHLLALGATLPAPLLPQPRPRPRPGSGAARPPTTRSARAPLPTVPRCSRGAGRPAPLRPTASPGCGRCPSPLRVRCRGPAPGEPSFEADRPLRSVGLTLAPGTYGERRKRPASQGRKASPRGPGSLKLHLGEVVPCDWKLPVPCL